MRDNIADYAAAHGWSDDSEWTPSFVSEQMTTVVDGILMSVKVMKDMTIRWGISPYGAEVKIERGTADSIVQAVATCETAAAAQRSVLFL